MLTIYIKFSIIVYLMSSTSSAMACSCRYISTETVAYMSNYSLSKLEIKSPSIIERLASFNIFNGDIKRVKVKVIEDIKGTYKQEFLDVNINDNIGNCGINIEYGQQVYLINSKNEIGQWSHSVSVCNMVSKDFAATVKAQIKNN